MLLTLLPIVVVTLLGLVSATAHERAYFYVGGGYEVNSRGENIFVNQTYVEKLTPAGGASRENPIVFIHGNGQTGTNWLNKPDGGNGWASHFLSQGYECYIIDQTFRGRSLWVSADGPRQTFSVQNVQGRFTAPELYRTWPQARLHTQWPGSGTIGDPIFDAYFASTVPSVTDETTQETAVRDAGSQLLDRIGKPVILVGHSQGGPMVWATADARPHLIHSVVAIEPAGPPFHENGAGNDSARAYGLTSVPLAYSPSVTDPADFKVQTVEPISTDLVTCYAQAENSAPRQLVNLSKFPVLVVTSEASYHAQYDWCTVRFLRGAGVKADHLELAKVGVHGNGHMMFLEKNSDDVAGAIAKWMHKH